jgi:nickel/cobalt exporter
MFMRTRREVMNANAHHHHGSHDHGHEKDHHHHGHVEHDHSNQNDSYQDAHERYHAEDIKRRFVGQTVSTGQIAMFGLTGGLVPCPASVTILMICLHLKKFSLGVAMVASFSFGLALSLVSVGVIAAWGAQQVGKRLDKGNLSDLARKMPYLSSGLMAVVATIMGIQALSQIMAG